MVSDTSIKIVLSIKSMIILFFDAGFPGSITFHGIMLLSIKCSTSTVIEFLPMKHSGLYTFMSLYTSFAAYITIKLPAIDAANESSGIVNLRCASSIFPTSA